eukprot:scaffold40948_cov44-Attheya_sp.AAC.3
MSLAVWGFFRQRQRGSNLSVRTAILHSILLVLAPLSARGQQWCAKHCRERSPTLHDTRGENHRYTGAPRWDLCHD